jgi:hypothetical protein
MVNFAPRMMPTRGSYVLLGRKDEYGVPSNNINGILFVQKFCSALSALRLSFNMHQVDAKNIQSAMAGNSSPRFARIDTSNIADQVYLGILRVPRICSPMLKGPQQNRHATLLTNFTLSSKLIGEYCRELGIQKQGDTRLARQLASKLLPPISSLPKAGFKPFVILCKEGRHGTTVNMFRDNDAMFHKYRKALMFAEVGTLAGALERKENKIVEKFRCESMSLAPLRH